MTITPVVSAKERLIVAIDVADVDEARRLVDELQDEVGMFKIGLELFSASGVALLDELAESEKPVFFDGKFHDIPNTVGSASKAITRHSAVKMFNVHASGGTAMIKAAVDGAKSAAVEIGRVKPIVIAVTVLTSIDDNVLSDEIGMKERVEAHVARLAALTKSAGADGVVASAQEVPVIRQACGKEFVIVTPGIRPTWASGDDQKRIVTPKDAVELGSDYIVVGRPITKADNRREAARRIVEEMEARA